MSKNKDEQVMDCCVADVPNKPLKKQSNTFSLQNKSNAKKFLLIGRREFVFMGREVKKDVPEALIFHSDFTENKRKYYIIKNETTGEVIQ